MIKLWRIDAVHGLTALSLVEFRASASAAERRTGLLAIGGWLCAVRPEELRIDERTATTLCGICWPDHQTAELIAWTRMPTPIEAALPAPLPDQKADLRAALDVYDVTLRVLGSHLVQPLPDYAQRQIDAAQDAYRQVTGDEPLSLQRLPLAEVLAGDYASQSASEE